MSLSYYWSKLIKKLPLSAVRECTFERPSKVEARSTVIRSSMGRYSYCGYGCTIINCEIGRFCSIADGVLIGLPNHPMDWVSTSCAFYKGKDSIPKDLARLEHDTFPARTTIGSDVWIGNGAVISQGVTIGHGAVVGMGAVVTKDVEPYSIVAGVPAREIRKRFDAETIDRLVRSGWWDMEPSRIAAHSDLIDDPAAFLAAVEGEL